MNRETAHTFGPEFPFWLPISLVRRTSSREAFSPALVHGAHIAPIAIAYRPRLSLKVAERRTPHEPFLPVLEAEKAWSPSIMRVDSMSLRLSHIGIQCRLGDPQCRADFTDRMPLPLWVYPVSVDGVGLGDWFDGFPVQFASMRLSSIFLAASGGAVDCFCWMPDRLGGGLKLARQLSDAATGTRQLDDSPPVFRRIRLMGSWYRGSSLPFIPNTVYETGSTSIPYTNR
jgi:hypothetical protein